MNHLFDALHDAGEIAAVFSEHHYLDCCLRFERALAEAQAALGVIPPEAAREIARMARIEHIDVARIRGKTAQVGLPIVGLVSQVVALCADDLGQYAHYGATTQDVMDCAQALQMQQALALVRASLDGLVQRLDSLASEHQATAQAGRTNQQHALPLSFGFKAAVWREGVARHIQRLDQLAPRAALGQLGAAVGTLASLGDTGHATRRHVLQALGLGEPAIAWHAMRDGPAEVALFLSQVAATLGKIGRDLLMMSSTEVGEVAFAAGRGASSTMPQKNNPVAASSVVALARMLFHTAPMLLDASQVENERSLDAWYIELHAMPQCFRLAGALLAQAHTMLGELSVHPERMAANLELTGGAIVSETVQMALAPHIGLNRAHHLVSQACQARVQGGSMAEALQARQSALGIEALQALLDVRGHGRHAAREVQAMLAARAARNKENP
jgi:3-carboxy-cis,cis-muconate cycloisomerase